MNLYWTSRNKISGLNHFVLINKFEVKRNTFVELVSVLDSNVFFAISLKELENSREWILGWIEIDKSESNVGDAENLNSSKKFKNLEGIYLNEESPFNIS